MKGIVIYHSGVGSTKRIAKFYQKNIVEHIKTQQGDPCSCDLYSIEEVPQDLELKHYDFLFIGFPTYHCEPSYSIKQFIDKMQMFEQPKPVFIFTTYGLYPANTLRIFAKLCKEKNLITIGSRAYRCPATDGVLITPNIKFFSTFARQLEKQLIESIQIMQETLSTHQLVIQIPRFKWYSLLNYPNKMAGLKWFKPVIYIHKERCIQCRKCIRQCPHQALGLDEKGNIKYERKKCEHCYRCIHRCPKQALSLNAKKVVGKQLGEKFYE